jgi:predicted component of type VI protein secretion system
VKQEEKKSTWNGIKSFFSRKTKKKVFKIKTKKLTKQQIRKKFKRAMAILRVIFRI